MLNSKKRGDIMSKNIENTRLKKLPTSQLVFYMDNQEIDDSKLKARIEDTIYDRLTRKYKMYPTDVDTFMAREHRVISSRGYDLQKYSFGRDMLYEELFKIFYENIGRVSRVTMITEDFTALTMSEIVEFYVWFSGYWGSFRKRQKKYSEAISDNERQQQKVLDNRSYSLNDKRTQIEELQSLSETLKKRQKLEYELIGYNDLLSKCLKTEFKDIMGLSRSENMRSLMLVLQEFFYLKQSSPIQVEEGKQFKDLNFDAYSYYTSVPSQYDVQGYSFSKKR